MSKTISTTSPATSLGELPQFSSRWISQLRFGLGLSRADFARRLSALVHSGASATQAATWEDVANWEADRSKVPADLQGPLVLMAHQSEAFNERTRLRPIAESAMSEFKLTQIEANDLDELEGRLSELRPNKTAYSQRG